jgi:cation:H+ antiporter
MIPLFMIAGGFVLLVYGANRLVDGASALAKRYHVSGIIIGLTIVALGTSTPELVINLIAATGDNTEIVLGNVVGSNIMNVLVILGIASLIHPLAVQTNTTWVEIPLSLLAALVVLVMGSDVFLNQAPQNIIDSSEGIVLLGFFIIFAGYTLHLLKSEDQQQESQSPDWSIRRSILFILLGLVLSVAGGRLIVSGAVDIARALGISERIIGLTIIAMGTSLPELATSIVAIRKKQADLAIGNIVGSNIFNLFFILGLSAVISPIPVAGGGFLDFGVLILSGMLLFVFVFTGKGRKLNAWEGLVFLVLYTGYLAYLLLGL